MAQKKKSATEGEPGCPAGWTWTPASEMGVPLIHPQLVISSVLGEMAY